MAKCQGVCSEQGEKPHEAVWRCPTCGKLFCHECALSAGIAYGGVSRNITPRCVFDGAKLRDLDKKPAASQSQETASPAKCSTLKIRAEADTLAEAKAQLKARVPEGMVILSSKTVSGGRPYTITQSAATYEKAYQKAKAKIPKDAVRIEQKEIQDPKERTLTVEALDEDTAKAEAKKRLLPYSRITHVHTEVSPRGGFLGFGQKPGQYRIEAFQNAKVQVTYTKRAVVTATVGPPSAKKDKKKRSSSSTCPFWKDRKCKPPGAPASRCTWPRAMFTQCSVYQMAQVRQKGGSAEDALRSIGVISPWSRTTRG